MVAGDGGGSPEGLRYAIRAFFFRARLWAVTAAMTWQIQPSRPPDPIQRPGVMISQKIPRRKSPL